MGDNITFTKYDDYLLVSFPDKVITVKRALEILARVSDECSSSNCTKVLLDKRSVESREIAPEEIEALVFEFNKNKPDKVHIAFLCQPRLVGYDSHLPGLYTYMSEFIIRHFTNKDKAIGWLNNKKDS